MLFLRRAGPDLSPPPPSEVGTPLAALLQRTSPEPSHLKTVNVKWQG